MKKKCGKCWRMDDDWWWWRSTEYSRKGARLNIKDEKICFFFFCFKVGEGGEPAKLRHRKSLGGFGGGWLGVCSNNNWWVFFGGPKGCRVYGRIRYIDTLCTLQTFLADLLVFKGFLRLFDLDGRGMGGMGGMDGWIGIGGDRWEKRSASWRKKKKKKRSDENRGSATAAGHG